jgi:hypothetical protein
MSVGKQIRIDLPQGFSFLIKSTNSDMNISSIHPAKTFSDFLLSPQDINIPFLPLEIIKIFIKIG